MIYIGADHRGFELKEFLKEYLKNEGHEVEDVGAFTFNPEDDYVDYAIKTAEMVEGTKGDKGILLCGSGHGMELVANRFPNVRAILSFNDDVTQQGREDEDANIIVLPADYVSEEEAKERLRIFLTTEKSTEERHVRRRNRIANLRIK